jgi:hypothetical protein
VIHKSNIPLNKKITPRDSIIYMGSLINTASKISKTKCIEETASENYENSYKD